MNRYSFAQNRLQQVNQQKHEGRNSKKTRKRLQATYSTDLYHAQSDQEEFQDFSRACQTGDP
jgi:hypothetical protein